MTPEEESLVKGSSRHLCFACASANLRPLISIMKEGFPPGDPRHNIGYWHDEFSVVGIANTATRKYAGTTASTLKRSGTKTRYARSMAAVFRGFMECLPGCPQSTLETCACKVHQSLRSSWSSLPMQVWNRHTGELPSVILQIADPDQERLVISGVCVEVVDDLPRLAPKNGKWPAFDATGIIKAEGNFRQGQMTGRWTYWRQNGQKKSEGEYVEDLREGKWVEWNEHGKVVGEQIFHKGQPIKP